MNIYTKLNKTLAKIDGVRPQNKKKRKRSKVRELERKRYSILTDDLSVCFKCKRPKNDLHEIYEGKNRQNSMIHGFVIPLCRECHFWIHHDIQMNEYYKQMCQKKFEENHTRDEFMDIIHRNYL